MGHLHITKSTLLLPFLDPTNHYCRYDNHIPQFIKFSSNVLLRLFCLDSHLSEMAVCFNAAMFKLNGILTSPVGFTFSALSYWQRGGIPAGWFFIVSVIVSDASSRFGIWMFRVIMKTHIPENRNLFQAFILRRVQQWQQLHERWIDLFRAVLTFIIGV